MQAGAGVLLIIAGIIALLRGMGRVFIGGALDRPLLGLGLEIVGGFLVLIAIVIILGGIVCFLRKMWWLALIASILAAISVLFVHLLIGLLGIMALIFIVISKKEFA
jgi:lysylphosphatidylglycerol synthetase-like protein (DUF2156 family)